MRPVMRPVMRPGEGLEHASARVGTRRGPCAMVGPVASCGGRLRGPVTCPADPRTTAGCAPSPDLGRTRPGSPTRGPLAGIHDTNAKGIRLHPMGFAASTPAPNGSRIGWRIARPTHGKSIQSQVCGASFVPFAWWVRRYPIADGESRRTLFGSCDANQFAHHDRRSGTRHPPKQRFLISLTIQVRTSTNNSLDRLHVARTTVVRFEPRRPTDIQ